MAVPFTKKVTPCRHFAAGKCVRGKACPFAHAEKVVGASPSTLSTVIGLVFEKQADRILCGDVIDISSFANCPDLEAVSASIDFNTIAFCDALCTVIKRHCNTAQFFDVSGNGIKSLFHLTKALDRSGLALSVRGISAKNNSISTFEFMKHLKGFPHLVELQLAGNPVADAPDYRSLVRKGLPQLLGLDGEGVNRPPLNLPWPQPAATHAGSPQAAIVDQLVEMLFRNAERSGVDAVSPALDLDCIFSFTMDADAAVKAPPIAADFAKRSQVLRDYVAVKMAQTDRDNNSKGSRSVKAVQGRTDVAATMRSVLYPRNFDITHDVSPNAEVVSVAQGCAVPMHVVTFHGSIHWRHTDQPDDVPSVVRLFDRTVVVVPTDTAFAVSNDAFHLRSGCESAVWFAQNPERVRTVSEASGLPPEVVAAVVATSTNDVELAAAVEDIKNISPDQLTLCLQATGSPDQAVVLARVVLQTGATPATALQILQQCGFSYDAAVQAAAA